MPSPVVNFVEAGGAAMFDELCGAGVVPAGACPAGCWPGGLLGPAAVLPRAASDQPGQGPGGGPSG
jgi:hypothetical protein